MLKKNVSCARTHYTMTDSKFLLILAAPMLAGAFCLGYCSGVFGWVGC